ncbi:hypothetical protein [Acidovorax sp. Root70]|uniref:hypothetical protein n=1 Tax=Acidovorax sp. Root70 TaxID=1736590 RepID=UPI0012E35CB6|nr:hypothetical protein [Acidovorax sp. Root70]
MKPVFGVIFRPDAPIDLSVFNAVMTGSPLGQCPSIRCSEVLETSFGFLQLHPMDGEKNHGLTLFVPPSYVLYMLRAEADKPFGFLPAAPPTGAQSDQVG